MLDRHVRLVATELDGTGVAHPGVTTIPAGRHVFGETALQAGGGGSILTGLWRDLGHL